MQCDVVEWVDVNVEEEGRDLGKARRRVRNAVHGRLPGRAAAISCRLAAVWAESWSGFRLGLSVLPDA